MSDSQTDRQTDRHSYNGGTKALANKYIHIAMADYEST